MDLELKSSELETPADAGEGSQGVVKRWLMEIELSGKTEKKWRDNATKAITRYRDEKDRTNTQFNIYWANVETMRPALYSTPPKLDIRRRFADADPVGKLAAEVMERALDFSIDSYDFDEEIDNAIMDYLIPSRGVCRVRFNPVIEPQMNDGQPVLDETGQPTEAMTYATTQIEHVAWDRFRRGPGLVWREVPWIAYGHQLTRDEIEKQFPGYGEKVGYDISMEGVDDKVAETAPSVYKRVQVWEVWDKQKKQILFIAPSYDVAPLKTEEDKLNLEGFFDCERPLYAVKTSTSLVPVVESDMYRDQMKELDRVTARITKIVSALKVRGIYDATITELKSLMKAADNEMIPTSTGGQAMAAGGLEKAVWMMPIAEAAGVVKELITYRNEIKQTIYEITGLSDILRGATDPNETLGAQKLKAQTGSKRIQRRQRDIQRFIRGLLRKKAEIIAENYTPQLLALMTGIQLPTEADKAAAQQQATQQQPGQPPQAPDPKIQELLASPTWEDVMKVLKSDPLRSFRIDIETDSTIAADQEADREAVTEMVKGISDYVQGIGPAVESGFISSEAAKKILLASVRRFKFGREVEDAIDHDSNNPPPQKPDPEAAKMQAQMQLEQSKLQGQQQLEQMKMQNSIELEKAKAQIAAQSDQTRAQADAQLAQAQQAAQAQQDTLSQQQQAEREKQKLIMEHESDIQKMLLDHKLDLQQIQAQNAAKLQEIAAKHESDSLIKHQELSAKAASEAQDLDHEKELKESDDGSPHV